MRSLNKDNQMSNYSLSRRLFVPVFFFPDKFFLYSSNLKCHLAPFYKKIQSFVFLEIYQYETLQN